MSTLTIPVLLSTSAVSQLPGGGKEEEEQPEGGRLPSTLPGRVGDDGIRGIQDQRDRFLNSPIQTSPENAEDAIRQAERHGYTKGLREQAFGSDVSSGRRGSSSSSDSSSSTTFRAVQFGAPVAHIYGTRVVSNLATLRAAAPATGDIASVTLQGGRLSQGTARAIYAAETANAARTGAQVANATRAAQAGSTAARVGAAGAGRLASTYVPILGILVSCGFLAYDLYDLGSMEQEAGESDEAFQQRLSDKRTDVAVNVGCTAAGGVIGGIIGSFIPIPGVGTLVGVSLGMAVGNLIGEGLKKGGWLRNIGSGIGRLFGFG